MKTAGIYITTIFAVLEGTILVNMIDPVSSALGINIFLWTIAIIILVGSFLKMNKK